MEVVVVVVTGFRIVCGYNYCLLNSVMQEGKKGSQLCVVVAVLVFRRFALIFYFCTHTHTGAHPHAGSEDIYFLFPSCSRTLSLFVALLIFPVFSFSAFFCIEFSPNFLCPFFHESSPIFLRTLFWQRKTLDEQSAAITNRSISTQTHQHTS